MAEFGKPEQQPYEVVEIGGGAWRIEDGMVRAFLIEGEERALVVDTTMGGGGSLRAVLDGLTDKPLVLVNTHSDRDHTAMNREFDEALMHPAEMSRYQAESEPGDAAPAPLWEGDEIDLGGRTFEVVLLSGHTPGSIALVDRDARIAITGDMVSSGPVFLFGNGRDLTSYRAGLARLRGLMGEVDELWPSHGDFPLGPDALARQIAAADKLAAGQIDPQDPPMPLPAKLYFTEGAGFFF